MPPNHDYIETVIEKDELVRILEIKRRNHRTRTVLNDIASRCGYIDTSHSALLTTDKAVAATAEKGRQYREETVCCGRTGAS